VRNWCFITTRTSYRMQRLTVRRWVQTTGHGGQSRNTACLGEAQNSFRSYEPRQQGRRVNGAVLQRFLRAYSWCLRGSHAVPQPVVGLPESSM
jgi:hypothetical protein